MDENVLMICDGEKAVGIAGIMGGENSMITDNVKTMLFEAACFDGTEYPSFQQRESVFVPMLPANLKKVWIRTMHMAAINRACQLIEELGAGEVVGGVVDVYPEKKEPVSSIHLSRKESTALLGTDICKEADAGVSVKLVELGL